MPVLICQQEHDSVLVKVTDMLGTKRSVNRRPLQYADQDQHGGGLLDRISKAEADQIIDMVEQTEIPFENYRDVIDAVISRLAELLKK